MIVNKITHGFVIQSFDTEKRRFVSQEFIAGDECVYEDENGDIVDYTEALPTPEPYLPFEMEQPKARPKGK
jgi:hypothetical protein